MTSTVTFYPRMARAEEGPNSAQPPTYFFFFFESNHPLTYSSRITRVKQPQVVQKAGVKYDCSHSGRDTLMVMGIPGERVHDASCGFEIAWTVDI